MKTTRTSQKKFYWIFAALAALMLTVTGCSGTTTESDSSSSPETSSSQPATTSPPETTAAAEEEAGADVVVYEVTSDSTLASSVTWSTMIGGNMGQEQAVEAPLPFTTELALEKQGMFDFSSFTINAQAAADATTISCKIYKNGEVIAENTSTGPYAVVMCSAS